MNLTPHLAKAWGVLALVACCAALVSCKKEYDFEREDTPTRSLGHELFVIWKDTAELSPENPSQKTQMLDDNYIEFVDAIDTIAPEDDLEAIDQFLINLLKVVDEGILPAITRKLQAVIEKAVQDDALLRALATPTGPDTDSFVENGAPDNFLGHASGYPRLPELLGMVSRIAVENDGVTDEGVRTFEEPAAISDMTRVLARELREATPSDEEPLAITLRDMALSEDPEYAADQAVAPMYVVLFDERGYPLAAPDGAGGVSFPFVDNDGDGLADLNPAGEFVYQNGNSGMLEPFALTDDPGSPVVRDAFGRATLPGGQFAFQYVDIHSTGLGFLVREFQPLSAKDTLYDMLVAFQTVMGPKTVHTDEIGGYEGYAADQPLNQLTYSLVHMMATPAMPEVMEDLAILMERHPDAIAALMYEMDNMVEILNKHNVEMDDRQTMAYDALPYLQEIAADPLLFADVMAAMEKPIFVKTGEPLALMLRYKDSDTIPATGGAYDSCFLSCEATHEIGTLNRYNCIRNCPNSELFSEAYDPAVPETERGRAQLQKFLHLIHDTAGVPYSMAIKEASLNGSPLPDLPPLLHLEGAGEAFMASVAGNLDLAEQVPDEVWASDLGDLLDLLGADAGSVASLLSTLSPLFGTELDERPRPHQITRLFNQKDLRFETDSIILDVYDPVCKDGHVMANHLAYGLFLGEASGAIDTIHPMAVAFSAHKKEWVLAGLFGVLHNHYTSDPSLYKKANGNDSEMKGGNLRVYEESLEELMSNEDFFLALHNFSLAVRDVEQSTGRPVKENLRQLLAHALKEDGFRKHNGDDFIIIDDGRTVSNPTRMHVMIDAVGEASIRLKQVPETRRRLRAAVGNLIDVMVGAEKPSAGQPRFKRTGSPALAADSMRYIANLAREKQAAGLFVPWLEVQVAGDLEELWTSRLLASLVDLASNTLENEADVELIDDFLAYMLATPQGRAHTLSAIYKLLVQSVNSDVWLPISRFLADAVDPDAQWETEPFREVPILTLGAQMLKKTLEYDPQNTGIFMIHRALLQPPGKREPWDVLVDMIAAYFSPDPLAEQLQTPEDYRHFMLELNDYMGDDLHGVERLYELVSRRQR